MLRHLRPRFAAYRWGGGALPDDGTPHDDQADGYGIAFQWLGMMVELNAGRVRSVRR